MNWKIWFRKKFPTHVERKILKKLKGRTLDLGCGKGLFLYYCRNDGIEIFGVDCDKMTVRAAKKLSEKRVFLSDALNLGFKNNTFDNIVSLDVLEHVKNPEQMLKEVKRILKPGGRLYLHVPRMNSVFGVRKDHLTLFSKQSLEEMVKKYFKIEELESVGFRLFIRPPIIPPPYNPFWVLSTFVVQKLPEFLSTHYYVNAKNSG